MRYQTAPHPDLRDTNPHQAQLEQYSRNFVDANPLRHKFNSFCCGTITVVTKLPRLIAFDLDDTLAPSKARIPDRMSDLLTKLLEQAHVAVISGGAIAQFQQQLLTPLESVVHMTEEKLEKLHVLPTCGTHYEVRRSGAWVTVFREVLTAEERTESLTALREEAQRLGLWVDDPWGQILEDRGSQVTYSALGQQAPLPQKMAWDPSGEKKNQLSRAVQKRLPNLEVRSGGSTSVDITRRGIDKAYGMRKLVEHTGIPLDDMLFVGDRLDPDGNDYPVLAMGARCHEVSGWEDTASWLEILLRRFEVSTELGE